MKEDAGDVASNRRRDEAKKKINKFVERSTETEISNKMKETGRKVRMESQDKKCIKELKKNN